MSGDWETDGREGDTDQAWQWRDTCQVTTQEGGREEEWGGALSSPSPVSWAAGEWGGVITSPVSVQAECYYGQGYCYLRVVRPQGRHGEQVPVTPLTVPVLLVPVSVLLVPVPVSQDSVPVSLVPVTECD